MPSDWLAFETRLATTLRDLPHRSFLIVAWSQANVYVQFAADDDGLAAEAAGEDVVPDSCRYSIEQVGLMREAGWTAPAVAPPGNTNWTQTLPWPALSAQYADVAADCVLALRLRGVDSPQELTYRAWRDPERPVHGVTYYPGDLDEGDPRLELPSLDLEYTT